jgi:hypothetical protein
VVQLVELIPLVCFKCDTLVPAQPDEVAWVCARCSQGLLLDEAAPRGLTALDVQYGSGIDPARKGKPFWVVDGSVQLQRSTFSSIADKAGEARQLWSQPRRFFIPAFEIPLQTLAELGPRMLLNPPVLQAAPAVLFEPVTLSPADLPALAEFIVLAIEANRSDMLKQVQIKVSLSKPVLWVLP